MYKINFCTSFWFWTLIIWSCVCVVDSEQAERKCHNYYNNHEPQECNFIPDTENHCKFCVMNNGQNFTTCNAVESKMSVSHILNTLPNDTERLVIIFNNTWHGFLPSSPDPIDITGLVRLKKLQLFHLSDISDLYYQLYPVKFDMNALPALQNITSVNSFKIRIPVNDIGVNNVTLSVIVKHLSNLKVLDFSNSLGASSSTISDLLSAITGRNVEHLCLRRVQLLGGTGYQSSMTEIFDYRKNIILPQLVELDLSDNMIIRFPSGFARIAPIIQILDLSGNLLVHPTNVASLFEIIQQPSIYMLNLNYQGTRDHSRLYFKSPNSPTQIESDVMPLNNKITGPKAYLFISQCFNKVSSNISTTIVNKVTSCDLAKCLFPEVFGAIVCDEHVMFPELRTIICSTCAGYIRIPIGQNLNSLLMDHMHLEQTAISGIRLNGFLTITSPNNLKMFSFAYNNVWARSAFIKELLSNLKGLQSFDHLEMINLSHNFLFIRPQKFTGPLQKVVSLDLSYNSVYSFEYCMNMPLLGKLNLSSTNLGLVHPDMIQGCKNLQSIDLSLNDNIDKTSLNNISFEGISNLTYINFQGSGIHWLENPLLDNLKQFPQITIDFRDNRFICNCSAESQIFIKWFREMGLRGAIQYYNEYSYDCLGHNGPILVKNIKNFNDFYASCDPEHHIRVVIYKSVFSTLGVVATILMCILLYIYWWRIRYYWFLFGQNIKCQNKDKKNVWIYDAFISYCAEDRFWVHGTLMKELEKEYGFHLCVHYRDFPAGGSIPNTIAEKMSQSREIIVILSEIAFKSNWCQFELDQALLQTSIRDKSLITITLEDISNHCLNPKIAHILDSHTYLRWEDPCINKNSNRLFWKKLVAQMYNDPRGESCCCFCPYGANALGYEDLYDATADEEAISYPYTPVSNDPAVRERLRECCRQLSNYKRKAVQISRYIETVNQIKDKNDVHNWALRPMPWPIQQLLEHEMYRFDEQINDYAEQRIRLISNCLNEELQRVNGLYEEELCLMETLQL